jgi:hypothetical protein
VYLADGEAKTLDLAPRTLGLGRIHGSVTRNGTALPFATIQLSRAGGRKLATATADRFGQFECDGLAAGRLTLSVCHGAAGPCVASRALELLAGGERDEVIAVEYGSLAGRLVTASDKTPMADLRVDILAADGGVLATVRSGVDGRFTLPIVQAGTWSLAIARTDGGHQRQLAVEITANRATQLPEVGL